jgi:DNA polymerase-1
MDKKNILLIDGSSILSTCFFGNIPREYLKAKTDEEFKLVLPKLLQTQDGLYTNAIYGFCKILRKIEKNHRPDYMCIAWDLNRETFRRKIYPEYKAQRKKTRPELSSQFDHMQKLLKYVEIPTIVMDGYEADDIIGSMAEKYKNDVNVIILTKDQDSLQLIDDNVTVWLQTSKVDDIVCDLNIKQTEMANCLDKSFPFNKSRFEEYYGFKPVQMIDFKGISGDSSDNIPGIKGVGEKSALILIKEFGSIENLVNFLSTASKEDIENKKKELSNKGYKRIPFKAILEDINGDNLGLLSKTLATIKRDIEVPELEELKFSPNKSKEKKIYERLQFKSLL